MVMRPHSDWQDRLEMAGPSVLCAFRQQHLVLLAQRATVVTAPAVNGVREARTKRTPRLTATKLRTQRR